MIHSEVRVLRVLAVAIFFVSSSQFFFRFHEPIPSRRYATTIHDFYSAQTVVGSATNANYADDHFASSRSLLDQKNITNDISVLSSGAIENANSTKKTKDLVFCGTCSHDLKTTCNERLKYLMGKHHLPEFKARQDLMARCGIDYDSEPYVFLHAGPHKTGTTSIQSFLYDGLWNNATFLQEDKFSVPTFDELPGIFGGVGPMLNFAHCMLSDFVKDGGQMNIAMCNKVRFGKFPIFLQKNFNQSHNVLLVAEDLDRVKIDYKRIQYYLQPYRRFRVLVNYRRMHEWLPSWYNQIMDLYLSNYIQGKSRYPSFVEWINTHFHHFKQVHAIEVATRYRNSGKFESVEILNMHDGTRAGNMPLPLLENLFCNYIQFANATCQTIKNGKEAQKRNIGRTYEYERLATKAFLRGKIHNYHKVIAPKVADRIKNLVVERGIFPDGNAYPKICLNQTFLDHLLQTEMEQERKYFPKWYESQGGDEGLRKDFENSRHKMCSMDEERILDSGILDPIFEEINKR